MPAERDPDLIIAPDDIDRLAAGEALEIGDVRIAPHAIADAEMKQLRAGEQIAVRIFTPDGHRTVVLARSKARQSPDGSPQTARDHAQRAHDLLERARQSSQADPMLLVEANAHSATAIALGLAQLLADAHPELLAEAAAAIAGVGSARQ